MIGFVSKSDSERKSEVGFDEGEMKFEILGLGFKGFCSEKMELKALGF